MIGDKVFFLTGTDEHGAKIEEKAKKARKKPKEFTDEIAAKFQFSWGELNISNDNFIRTTDKNHIRAVTKALKFMRTKGDIYKGVHKGLYCRECEQFKTERDLVDGLCPEHKITPEKVEEESYMFKLAKYKDQLLEKIKNNELQILPKERKNEIISFYENEGLNDISFSRKNVGWGIPVPWDKSHTAYVWADAFLNYLTGIGWNGESESPPDKGGEGGFWPADVHLMSKDILRVHATIWPAMLLSLGLPLPKTLFIHGFFKIEGQKMSKSLGNVIAPEDLVRRYGVDAARYLLMSATIFGRDGDISQDKFDEKFNADLANGIGNLVARSITLASKINSLKSLSGGQELKVKESWLEYEKALYEFKIDTALDDINRMMKISDNYITTNKPWELIKKDKDKAADILYNILETIRHISWMLLPFMPETAEKIWDSLGLNPADELKKDFKKAIKWGGLPIDTKVNKGEALFPRL